MSNVHLKKKISAFTTEISGAALALSDVYISRLDLPPNARLTDLAQIATEIQKIDASVRRINGIVEKLYGEKTATEYSFTN